MHLNVSEESICIAGKSVGERSIRPLARHYRYGTPDHFDLLLDLFDGRVVDPAAAKPTIHVTYPCLTVADITDPMFFTACLWPDLKRIADRWDMMRALRARRRRYRRHTRPPGHAHRSKA